MNEIRDIQTQGKLNGHRSRAMSLKLLKKEANGLNLRL